MASTMGNHIAVSYGWYTHHGIDCGDDTVIHLSKKYNKVIRTSMSSFVDGKKLIVVQQPSKFSRAEVVLRAGERLEEEGYSPLYNNCEDFANECIADVAKSSQVNEITSLVDSSAEQGGIGGLFAAIVFGAYALAEGGRRVQPTYV